MAVGEAAARALQRLRRLLGEPAPELAHERRLADARVAHQRDEVRLALLDGVPVGRLQQTRPRCRGRRTPARRRGRRAVASGSAPGRACGRRPGPPCPSPSTSTAGPSSKAPRTASAVRAPTTISPGLGRLLEPGGDVDGVAGDERAAFARAAGDDLARVDADPKLERPVEERLEPALHRERGVQRPLGVVLVRLGDAEDGHDRVAGELLDRAAGARRSRRPSRRRSARAARASARDPVARRAPSSRRGRRRARWRACARRPPRAHSEARRARYSVRRRPRSAQPRRRALLARLHLVDVRGADELRDPDHEVARVGRRRAPTSRSIRRPCSRRRSRTAPPREFPAWISAVKPGVSVVTTTRSGCPSPASTTSPTPDLNALSCERYVDVRQNVDGSPSVASPASSSCSPSPPSGS